MGILENLGIRAPKISKYLNADGTPKTVITTSRTVGAGFGDQSRSEKKLKEYWNYYKNDDMVFAAVNIIAYNTVTCGYTLMSDNKKAKELIRNRFEKMNIDKYLIDNVRYGLVIGDAYVEKVKGTLSDSTKKATKKYTVALKTVSPITIIANVDKYGRVTDYQQKINGQTLPTKLSKEDIMHFKFFEDLDSPYGISMLQPCKVNIDRMRDVDESLYHAVQRHGTPKYSISVGTEDDIPPKAVFDKIKTDLEDITSQNELIHPGLISINTIDERGVPGVEAYADVFLKKTLVGLMCSQEALGMSMGSGTDAMANQRSLMFERFIKNLQYDIATQIRVELINQILVENGFEPDIVYMKFNSVTDADEEAKAKWIGNLFRGFPEGKKPLSINEIRTLFGFQSIKGGDDLIEGTVPADEDETSGYKPKKPSDNKIRTPAIQPAD